MNIADLINFYFHFLILSLSSNQLVFNRRKLYYEFFHSYQHHQGIDVVWCGLVGIIRTIGVIFLFLFNENTLLFHSILFFLMILILIIAFLQLNL